MGLRTVQWDPTRTFTALGVTDIDSEGPKLGYKFQDFNGNDFIFVHFNFGTAATIGNVVFWDQTAESPFAVNQLGSGSTGISRMAGVIAGAVPASGYGFVQWRGQASALCDGSGTAIVLGDILKGSSGTNKAIHDVAAGTVPANVLGFLVARAASSVSGLLAVSIHCNP